MGQVSERFDRDVLRRFSEHPADRLLALTEAEIEEQGGNGDQELRNWLTAWGMLGAHGARVLAYANVPEWISGIGIVEFVGAPESPAVGAQRTGAGSIGQNAPLGTHQAD